MLLHSPWGGESLLRSSGLTRVALIMVGEVARAVAAVDLLEAAAACVTDAAYSALLFFSRLARSSLRACCVTDALVECTTCVRMATVG